MAAGCVHSAKITISMVESSATGAKSSRLNKILTGSQSIYLRRMKEVLIWLSNRSLCQLHQQTPMNVESFSNILKFMVNSCTNHRSIRTWTPISLLNSATKRITWICRTPRLINILCWLFSNTWTSFLCIRTKEATILIPPPRLTLTTIYNNSSK